MLVHSLFVEGVDLRRLGGSPGGDNVIGDFYGCPEASREKKLGPLARKCACDSTADAASGSVDHGNLVLQHHLLGPPASFSSVPLVEAVDDADTATLGKWAPTNRPVRPSASVSMRMEVRQGAGER